MSENASTAILGLLVIALWLALVIGGIRLARQKNRSPHWMWFGLHPLGALVVLIVMAAISPLLKCPQCARKVTRDALVCAYCRAELRAPGERTAVTPQFAGVGGWLLFLCIALTILNPIINGVRLAQDFAVRDQISEYPALVRMLDVEMVLGVGLVVFGVIAGISLWSESPGGPRVTKGFFVASICYQIVMNALAFGSDLPYSAREAVRAAALTQGLGSIIAVAIWWSYLNRSKRVAALFPGEGAAAEVQPLSQIVHDREEPPAAAATPGMPATPGMAEARRGGFGEPYCSDQCYDAAGKLVADGLIQGTIGQCEFCGSAVDRRIGRVTGAAIPFHHRMLYVCTLCDERGRSLVHDLAECCFCSRPLAATAAAAGSVPERGEPVRT